jgi:hypothetical protein
MAAALYTIRVNEPFLIASAAHVFLALLFEPLIEAGPKIHILKLTVKMNVNAWLGWEGRGLLITARDYQSVQKQHPKLLLGDSVHLQGSLAA